MLSQSHPERRIVLPGIHEMFPEHLLKHPKSSQSSSYRRESQPRIYSSGASERPHTLTPNHPHPNSTHYVPSRSEQVISHPRRSGQPALSRPSHYSFDVLRSDPCSSSLQHIATSASFSHRPGASAPSGLVHDHLVEGMSIVDLDAMALGSPVRNGFVGPTNKHEHAASTTIPRGHSSSIISFTAESSVAAHSGSPDDCGAASDEDFPASNSGKKHVCPTCFKRFNRPSSLRIHVNTHTGATPFRCPWPNCAREFNVNSNMRRHYRNHAAPGVPRNQNSAESRRRRKRGDSQNLVFVPGGNPASYPPGSPTFLNSSSSTTSRVEESSDGSDYDDEDELDTPSDNLTPVSATLRLPWEASKNIFGSYAEKDHPPVHSAGNRYSQSHSRSGHPSNPSSPNCTPPLGHCTYIPSAPYSQSFADKKVSTALRPAFHAQSVLGRNAEEAMSF